MNKLKLLLLAAVTTMSVGFAAVPVAQAACGSAKECITSGVDSAGGSGAPTDVDNLIKTIVNVLLFILGAVSVIMIVVGGFKYVTSQGESSSLTSAKNTILYAVVGLVVAIAAYAIVNFVVEQFI
ncbi:MAG: hypothetical protein WBP12_04290 [Candidatus Saccharimonas sp.]